MAEDLVYLTDLADELGYTKAAFHRMVRRAGIEPKNVYSTFSRGQRTLAISVEEAGRVRALANSRESSATKPATTDPDDGVFYAAVADPMRPLRVKLGFTSDLERRLSDYRTIAPEVKVLFAIPCRRQWEATTMAALTNVEGCSRARQEVYDFVDTDALADRAYTWFAMLPPVDTDAPKRLGGPSIPSEPCGRCGTSIPPHQVVCEVCEDELDALPSYDRADTLNRLGPPDRRQKRP